MNDFNRHKRSDKIKWVFTGIAFVLVFVMLIGMCLQLFGTGKQKPSEWFKKPETEQTTPEIPDENGGAVISESASNGVRLMSAKLAPADYAENGISPQAESAYTLTATVTPATVDNKLIDWSVSWVNADSDFAAGKNVTDYVTVTPQSNGSATATVQCKQAFGEQINVMAQSRFNKDAYATCAVDYVKRVSSASFTVNKNGSLMFELGNVNTFEITPTYSVGTVTGEITVDSLDISLNSKLDGFVMQGLGSFVGQVNTCSIKAHSADTPVTPFSFMSGRGDYPYLAQAQNAYNVMLRKANTAFAQSNDCYLVMTVNFTYSYNGTAIQQTATAERNVVYSAGSLTEYAVVTSVSLNNSELYF